MARRRFLVPEILAGAAELRGDEARHLSRVLRAEPGQKYEISDGKTAWLAEITEVRNDRVIFRALEALPVAEPAVRVTLCAALFKFDRFEWMVEKATELGVDRIQPVESARCDKGLAEAAVKRRERWARIARESSQQSRRVTAPEIFPVLRFSAALTLEGGHRYFFDEGGAPPFLRTLADEAERRQTACVLIGPEGGWTAEERAAALAANWRAVSLGPLVLRAETATIAALALLFNTRL